MSEILEGETVIAVPLGLLASRSSSWCHRDTASCGETYTVTKSIPVSRVR